MAPTESVPSADLSPHFVSRLLFIAGDFLLNAAVGASTAFVVWSLVPSSWNLLARMPLAMGAGMLIAAVLGTATMPVLGAFEVVLPAMVTGMATGMLTPMLPYDVSGSALAGAIIGLVTIAATYCLTFWSNRG